MTTQQVLDSRYKFFIVGAIGTFMATLDGSILNVALPSIAADLNASVDVVAWVVLSYSLTLISLMMVFGAWTERRGYKFAYQFGYIFFLLGSALCASSSGIYMLIFSRVVQAIGTAMFAAVGPGMVTAVFPGSERGKGIGLMVMMVSAGFMVGPPLGGYLLGFFSWHSIFLINIPIGLFGLYMIKRYFGLLTPPQVKRPIKFLAATSVSLGLVSGVLALSFLDNFGVTDFRVVGLGLISVTGLAFFVWLERNPARALVGREMVRNRTFLASMAAQLMHFMGLSGVMVLVPFYLENVQHLEPKQVGLYLTILPVMMFLIAPLSGRLSDRIGYRVLTSGGMLILSFGLWLLSGLSAATEPWFVATCLVVIGCGVATFSTPNSSVFMGSVIESKRAVASGILATNRNIGLAVGVALGTTIFAYGQQANAHLVDTGLAFVESYRPVIYYGLACTLTGMLFCLVRANRAFAGEPAEESVKQAL